jgi:sulfoxide reductase catalytic subunit YedY
VATVFGIRRRRGWEIPESEATPEALFWNRREFLASLGLAGLSIAAPSLAEDAAPPIYPARRNPRFVLDRPLTDERVAATTNNFYEFSEHKDAVWRLVEGWRPRPWRIEITGLVERPRALDADDLIRALPVEERVYRHRCVEAWATAVPWTGIPMRDFVKWAGPSSGARYVRMVSFQRPEEALNQQPPTWYPWPYYEGLTLREAVNELALLAVGIYGHELPGQHGAPIRLVVPWKYGFKSIKGIVRFEFLGARPPTFWHDLVPAEYDFWANVDPAVPHRRWSQASEVMIGTGERRPTLPFNGYGEWVAGMYRKA